MAVTLPLPAHITRYFPFRLTFVLQWFSFWAFTGLLVLPFILCVYRLVTKSLGRTRRVKKALDDRSAPKTVIVMPVYKEEPGVLLNAINSVVDCDYPANCIHVFLSYDGGVVDEPYLRVIRQLGIPITLKSYPQSIDVTYKGARVTVSRFKHGGKRYCQKQTFKLIDKIYAEYLKCCDDLFVLFIDSDCILDRVCLQNFMYDMELKPGNKHNMLAMTGVITSTTERNTLLTVLQDMEYLHGQLFERSVESACGAVTCLPGALTMLRFSAFRKMAKYYFADKAEQCNDLFDFGKCHLGEDRWLTHLFMIGAKERYQIQLCTRAFCKTEAVQSFHSLLKQRRRWFLGFITNEVCMLTDFRLWKRYPLLCLVRFMQHTVRTTGLLFFVVVVSLIVSSNKVDNLPVGFLAMSLSLNYILMVYFGAKLKRFKAWLYPLMFILNPFFSWIYMVYGILTAGHRTWGGPRADAAAADKHTTPEEAVQQARALGDELNVDVNTFRATRAEDRGVPIHPSETIEGRFAAATRLPGGRFSNDDDGSVTTIARALSPLPGVPRIHPYPRCPSTDSVFTSDSGNPVCMPQSVDYLVTEEEQIRLYLSRKAPGPASVTSMEVVADASSVDDFSDSPQFQQRDSQSLAIEPPDEVDITNSRPQTMSQSSYNPACTPKSAPSHKNSSGDSSVVGHTSDEQAPQPEKKHLDEEKHPEDMV